MDEFGRIFQPICYLEGYQIWDSFVPATTNSRQFYGSSSRFVRLPPKPRKRTVEQHTNSISIRAEAGINQTRTDVEGQSNNFRTVSEANPKKWSVFSKSYEEKTWFLADFPNKMYILPKQLA